MRRFPSWLAFAGALLSLGLALVLRADASQMVVSSVTGPDERDAMILAVAALLALGSLVLYRLYPWPVALIAAVVFGGCLVIVGGVEVVGASRNDAELWGLIVGGLAVANGSALKLYIDRGDSFEQDPSGAAVRPPVG